MPAVLAFIMGVCVMGLAAAARTNRLHVKLEAARDRSATAEALAQVTAADDECGPVIRKTWRLIETPTTEVVDFAAAVPGQFAHTWEIDSGDFGDYKFETGGDPRDLYEYSERTELVARPSRPLATPVAPFAEWAGQPQTYESMRVGE